MTGPSPMGSLKGTPNSMISAPPASRASMSGTVASFVGKPAVMKVTKALREESVGTVQVARLNPGHTLHPDSEVSQQSFLPNIQAGLTSSFLLAKTFLIASAMMCIECRCISEWCRNVCRVVKYTAIDRRTEIFGPEPQLPHEADMPRARELLVLMIVILSNNGGYRAVN
jgi:hypothetical protein